MRGTTRWVSDPGEGLAGRRAIPVTARLDARLIAGAALLFAVALAARLVELGVPDLSQAEHHKLDAVASWRDGDLIVDGEHPALLKALVLLSTSLLGDDAAALRLPSALAGAGVAVLVMLIGRRLAGPVAGWTAGALMALGTLPVAIDRVGKEDTLMLLFALAAVLTWLGSEGRPRRWLWIAGFAGAAAATKYEALLLLPALAAAGALGLGPRPPRSWRAVAAIVASFLAVHLVLNPLILAPAQWEFIWDFTSSLIEGVPPPDRTVVPTSGFAAAGEVFSSKPVWYYALYLGVKAQAVWIGLALLGVGVAVWRRDRGDRLVLVWLVPYLVLISLVPFGFARYLAPVLPALAIAGGLGAAWAAGWLPRRLQIPLAVLLLAALAVPLARALPYPTMYVSALGGGGDRAMYWTPDDAGGNLGMAEAVAAVERRGAGGLVAVADPTLVEFLSHDRLRAVSVEDLPPRPALLAARGIGTVIVQPSQISEGNEDLFDRLERTATPADTVTVDGFEMVRVYTLAEGPALR